MPINPSSAAGAYASAARLVDTATQNQGKSNPLGEPGGFADMVKTAIETTQATGQAAEAKASELAAGSTDVVELVTAVAETELAIQSMVTVRDRMITAYQDIMNMPI